MFAIVEAHLEAIYRRRLWTPQLRVVDTEWYIDITLLAEFVDALGVGLNLVAISAYNAHAKVEVCVA